MFNTPAKKTELLTETSEPIGGGLAIAQTRQMGEVQASMVMAKKFPRDEVIALANIRRACERPRLATSATYAFKKGSSVIDGPSIRLAEAIAQSWGNLTFGFTELERKSGLPCGESLIEAFAWDLQSNTRRSMTFTVRHWQDTSSGGFACKDERAIYELCANQAARRVRACILAVIPGDIVDEALEVVEKTLANENNGKPIKDRVRDMVIAFGDLGVSQEMIEARIQHPVASIQEGELRSLGKIYTSIKDGIGKRDDFFTGSAKPTTRKEAPVIDAVETTPATDPRDEFVQRIGEANISWKTALATLVKLNLAESSAKKIDQVDASSISKVLSNWSEFVEEASL